MSQGQPLILILDVEMEAPIITMPRESDSKDAIKLDLGSLHVGNSIDWYTGNSLRDPKVGTSMEFSVLLRWVLFSK